MITAASTNSKFSITFQGDQGTGGHWLGYTASRSMLRIKREDVQQVSKVEFAYGYKTVTYYTDPDGVLEISMRNEINAREDDGFVDVFIRMFELDNTSVDNFAPTIDILPGISYYDLYAPKGKDGIFGVTSLLRNVIMPPNVIVSPYTNGQGVIVESNYHSIATTATWSYEAGGATTAITPSGTRSNQIVVPYTADALKLNYNGNVKEWSVERPEQCADVVLCRWTSQTGAVRQHYFPIVADIYSVDKAVSLVTEGDGYLVNKDWNKGVRCRLTGLTAYGYWYYMDMLRASDLHAIIQPTYSIFSTEIASEQTAAYAEGSMETPQGPGFFAFEFTLKLRHYGQV